ncbi:MAG TPA: hypothetical protein VHV29_06955 [Terriglobales bacterium]|nr:hypothetical protein [Terriglobales bacterium]
MTAAAVYNVNRGKAEDPMLTPYDFVRDEESSRKHEELQNAKRFIKKALGNQPMSTPREKLLEIRLKVISDVRASGRDDAEQLVNECWPSLKPKEHECPK